MLIWLFHSSSSREMLSQKGACECVRSSRGMEATRFSSWLRQLKVHKGDCKQPSNHHFYRLNLCLLLLRKTFRICNIDSSNDLPTLSCARSQQIRNRDFVRTPLTREYDPIEIMNDTRMSIWTWNIHFEWFSGPFQFSMPPSLLILIFTRTLHTTTECNSR